MSMHGSMIRKVASAKLNLFLHITGRRDDGMHLLESIFVRTKKGDIITVKAADALDLTVIGPYGADLSNKSCTEDNLVMRAAKMLQKAAKIDKGATIILDKNLPIASGVGGGSADAAATLLALNDLWKLDWSIEKLSGVALALGADVPACLHNTPIFVKGIGEDITPQILQCPRYVLLVNPNVMVPTPSVFKEYAENTVAFQKPLSQKPLSTSDLANFSNSLEGPAVALAPSISEVLQALKDRDGVCLVRMSGSGATCFALFEDQTMRDRAWGWIEENYKKWWVCKDELIL